MLARACDRRITYWTGWLSPESEGMSKEVFALKDHFRRSRIFGLSRHYEVKASWRARYLGLNVRWYPLFRMLVPLYEAASDLHHIYGGISEWFFLRALGRRPVVITAATADSPLPAEMYQHVRAIVVHSRESMQDLERAGMDGGRMRLIYPGIDLERFHPVPRSPGSRFRILFATAPNAQEHIAKKGVGLLLDAASRLPDVEFVLLWRPWGDSLPHAREMVAERALPTVRLACELVSDMRDIYRGVDATVAPFMEALKFCPTSLVESLACGRPVLVSSRVGLGGMVQEAGCGEVFEPTAAELCEAIERMRRQYDAYARQARVAAERHFDLRNCVREHEDLYEEVLTCRP